MPINLIEYFHKKSPGRTDVNYHYAANYIANNWEEYLQLTAADNFLNYFERLDSWNQANIKNLAVKNTDIQKWLLSSSKCQVLYNTYYCLLNKLSEYATRISNAQSYHAPHISETVNHYITGRGPELKLEATTMLRDRLLDFALNHSDYGDLNLSIPENFKDQFNDCGSLSKIYNDIAFIQTKLYILKIGKLSKPTFENIENLSFSKNHNQICFYYLKSIKDSLTPEEIRSICLNHNCSNLGAHLSIIPEHYSEHYDFTLLYHLIIKDFNLACQNLLPTINYIASQAVIAEIDKILNKIAYNIYENTFDITQYVKDWLMARTKKSCLLSPSQNRRILKKQVLDLLYHDSGTDKSDIEFVVYFDPRYSESELEKLRVNFSDESDPMSTTNIPYKHRFISDNLLRMGCQTRTVAGNIEVYPSFIRYLHALKNKYITDSKQDLSSNLKNYSTLLLYISNLRTDDRTSNLEATIEGHRNKALINLAEITPGFDVVIMPANRGFLSPEQRKLHDPILIMDNVINEITTIVFGNGQDFYLSDRIRSQLFSDISRPQQYILIKQWVEESINDLFKHGQRPFEISPATRQQIATHFFKYTLTDKLLTSLNPYRYTTPCKDNIDRGIVHIVYYRIIKLILTTHANLEDTNNLTENDLENIEDLNNQVYELLLYYLNYASLIVKGRIINSHNFELLVHTLTGFMAGSYGSSPVFPKSLKLWLNENNLDVSKIGLLSSTITDLTSSTDSLGSPTSDQEKSKLLELISDDKLGAAERATLRIPTGTKIPLFVSKSASIIGNAPNLLLYAATKLKNLAMVTGYSVASGLKTVCTAYQGKPEATIAINPEMTTTINPKLNS